MERKAGSRKVQAEETKAEIYRVALSLMGKNGYHGTTIGQISRAAHVSVGAFYHHFSSKEELFHPIYDEADQYFLKVVEPALKLDGSPDRIVEFFGKYADYNEKVGLDTMKVLYNSDNQWFIKRGRFMQEVLNRVIQASIDKGTLDPTLTLSDINQYLFITARGVVYDWCLHEGGYPLAVTMKLIMGRLIRGMV